jgi:putative chitinase
MNLNEALKRASVSNANIDRYVPFLAELAPKYGIDTPLRLRHFLAQLLHESGGFNHVRENLNYSADGLIRIFHRYFPTMEIAIEYARKPERIANRVYSNRMGNGTEESGDGWRYIGRGLIQTTGKHNYTRASQAMFGDNRLLVTPELLEEPRYAVESGCYFWKANNLNEFADRDDIIALTRRINGGTNGLDDRRRYYNALTMEG